MKRFKSFQPVEVSRDGFNTVMPWANYAGMKFYLNLTREDVNAGGDDAHR